MLRRTLLALALVVGTMSVAGAQPALSDIHAPKVTMYATATCGYCAKARTWFTEHDVQWEERDIEKSASAAAEWKAAGGVGTPLIVIGEAKINGFDEAKIGAELAKYAGKRS
ncbi:glutaredoxin family protein [Dokdonella fugitiva]|jgi:glutaredoxin|uniref:Glutaredoxin n=1 Tax=Dokdonella fugitiva TaxID=328517 RepID=A0A4R2IA70_9GAMM|nr:glutaredoxin domain-containing protein [Dokdonella fugitiva]MBA8883609.1 glutaredoxin [Dokdonella fugitiva]TCO41351.1 glutaredoxin [Dokdonella fugitiva]